MSKFFLILGHARSGSTHLSGLIRCHPKIGMKGELIADMDPSAEKNLSEYLKSQLDNIKKEYKGFKVLIETLSLNKTSLNSVINAIQADYVVVIWRESFLGIVTIFCIGFAILPLTF